jgi:acetyl esterase/lipase
LPELVDVADRLDPEIAGIVSARPVPTFDRDVVAAFRDAPRPVSAASPDLDRWEVTVPACEGSPPVILRVHRPRGAVGPLPGFYWMHGGGYVVGSAAGEDARLERWCTVAGCVGIAVEYRLAPEHPYPAPLDDCDAGLRWVVAHAEELGVDPARIGVGGSSAGGGLAAGLTLLTRDRGEIELMFQLLNCPMLDDRQLTASSRREVPVWNPASNRFGWQSYLGPRYGTDDVPPYAAPARAGDLAGLPPALVAVGTVDGFFDEDVAYAERLNRSGVDTELHVYPGAPHGFDSVGAGSALARRWAARTVEWLLRQFRH